MEGGDSVTPSQVDIQKVTEKRGFGHYEKVTQIDTLPAGTGGQNGLTHERTKSGNAGNRKGVPKRGQERKSVILDRYVRLTGYNRKCAIRVLSMPLAKTATMARDGKTVAFKAEKWPGPKKTPGQTTLHRGNRRLPGEHPAVLPV
jgi:hypothetical protein